MIATISTCAVWLLPEGEAREAFEGIIIDLARAHGKPVFQPHVTLLSGLRGSAATLGLVLQSVAARVPVLQLEVTGLAHTDEYFRSLYAEVEACRALVEAHQRAHAAFAPEATRPFSPHLSLMYGTVPVQTRQQIVAQIGPRLPARIDVGSLDLWSVAGEVTGWYQVAGFPLRARSLEHPEAGTPGAVPS